MTTQHPYKTIISAHYLVAPRLRQAGLILTKIKHFSGFSRYFICLGSILICLIVSLSWPGHGVALEGCDSNKQEAGHEELTINGLKVVPQAFCPGKHVNISGSVRGSQTIAQAGDGKKDSWGEKGTEKDDWGDKGTEEGDWGDEKDEWGDKEKDEWGDKEKDEFGEEEKGETPWKGDEVQKKSPFKLSGRFWNRFGQDLDDDSNFEDDNSNHAELQLKFEYTPNDTINLLLSVDVDYFLYRSGDDWDDDCDVRPYEAYVKFSETSFELTVGNQFVRWGKTDEVSPLDIVNPEDLRDGFVRSREERKIPIPMLNMKWFKGMFKLEGLFIPFFIESKVDKVGRDWAFFDHYDREVGYFFRFEEEPPNNLHSSEAGIRLSGTIKNLDFAFSYFHTRDDLPSIDSLILPPFFPIIDPDSVTLEDLVTFAVRTNQPVLLKYDRQNVTGFEFETTWRDFGLRGEVAYVYKKTFLTDRLQSVRKPVYHYVLGADYNGPDSFYCNLQFSQQIIQHYDDNILFSSKVTNMVNGKVSKGFFDDNVEIGVRYLYNFTDEDYYINPHVILKYWKNITLDFGFEIEGGPPESTLGTYDDNSEVYGVFQYRF